MPPSKIVICAPTHLLPCPGGGLGACPQVGAEMACPRGDGLPPRKIRHSYLNSSLISGRPVFGGVRPPIPLYLRAPKLKGLPPSKILICPGGGSGACPRVKYLFFGGLRPPSPLYLRANPSSTLPWWGQRWLAPEEMACPRERFVTRISIRHSFLDVLFLGVFVPQSPCTCAPPN